MENLIYIFLFIFWTIFGSFGSVLVRRLRWKIDKNVIDSILFGRSQCPNCHHRLGFFDLFPIFSYIFWGWKCRYCKTKISSLYPIIEILTGIIFCLSYYLSKKFGFHITETILFFLINYILVLILMFDILFYELWNFFYLSLCFLVVWFFVLLGQENFIFAGKIGILYFLVFFVLYFFAKIYASRKFWEPAEWFWYGDVLMALPLGMLMSIVAWYTSFWGFLLLSSLVGIIFSLPSLVSWRLGSIAFLPAMIITTWIFLTFWDFLSKIFLY